MRYGVVGFFDYQSGLAVAARNTVVALRGSGREVDLINARVDGALGSIPKGTGPIDIALLHANPWPEFTPRVWAEASRVLRPRRQLNVCAPFFELPAVPITWLDPLAGMDVLLASTRHLADALKRDIPSAETVYLPQTVLLPADVRACRGRFGIPESAFAFVTSFDAGSSLERKNPWGAIEAFRRAFPSDDSVRLVVRARLGLTEALGDLEQRLIAYAGGDQRIVLARGDMDYDTVLSLYASCDAYISLHRAEGLGLGPMEAMALGVPVIATGWSGNMDFMTEANSMPVAYRMVPMDVPQTSIYHASVPEEYAVWAEPDLDDAAALMVRIARDTELARRLSAQARSDMNVRRDRFLSGRDFCALEALAEDGYLRGATHAMHAAALQRSIRAYVRSSTQSRLREWLAKRVPSLTRGSRS